MKRPIRLAPLVCTLAVLGCRGVVGPAVDGQASESDGAVAPRPEGGPVDAPPSTCSPDSGCGPGETCWLGLDGAHRCARYHVRPASPVPSWVSSCEPADGGFPGDVPPATGCCTHDDQCTAQPRGRCVPVSHCGGVTGRRAYGVCSYNLWCTSDAECGERRACLPNSPGSSTWPVCVGGACRTSADCTRKPGGQCLLGHTGGACGGGYFVLYCSYPSDVCRVANNGNDCPTGDRMQCVPAEDGHGTRCQPDPGQPP
jgi:hypothetical protein